MNSKHRKTLEALYKSPTPSNIKWTDIESLFVHMGAELQEGNGSRIRVALHGVRAVFHKPHPKREVDKGALRSIKRFLENAGVTS